MSNMIVQIEFRLYMYVIYYGILLIKENCTDKFIRHMAMCYFSRVLETRNPSLFQQCSQLKPTIHFHLAKLKSTNIQIPINNLQSQGVKIALMSRGSNWICQRTNMKLMQAQQTPSPGLPSKLKQQGQVDGRNQNSL